MIPVAVFAQNIGADKNWDDATSTVKLKKDTVTVLLTTGDNKLYKNDKAEEMDTTAVINDGRMFIPVRFAAEAFDYKVDFKNSTITLSSNGLNSAKDTLGLSLKLMPYMPKDQNYMISPISLKLALAMAANAADGETKKQMLDTLGISDLSTYNDYADKLIKNYAGSSDSDMTIDIANSIWLNEDKFKDYSGMAFADPFKNIVKTFFHG
ncbi:MAG: stalk domain-containing protein, partial [Bacillota bacterium]|nr:stalk domain-containing protein [Bacillota bacterium]